MTSMRSTPYSIGLLPLSNGGDDPRTLNMHIQYAAGARSNNLLVEGLKDGAAKREQWRLCCYFLWNHNDEGKSVRIKRLRGLIRHSLLTCPCRLTLYPPIKKRVTR